MQICPESEVYDKLPKLPLSPEIKLIGSTRKSHLHKIPRTGAKGFVYLRLCHSSK